MGHAEAAAPIQVPPAVALQAVEWLVALQSAEADDATHRALLQWCAQHPDHERAWRHIAAVNAHWRGALGSAGPAAATAAHGALMVDTVEAPSPRRRRQAIKTVALMLGVGGAAWMARDEGAWRAWSADAHTGIGQRRTVTLADGSTVALNTGSAIDVRFTSGERRVLLVQGEILVSTGKQGGGRPFVVETRHGVLRPLGTRFAVRQEPAGCRVDVFEGAVAIHPRHGAAASMRILRAGERAVFTSAEVDAPGPADGDSIAWTDGMLVASGMRLADFVAEVGRHRHGRLVCDPAIAGLRVSGTYPLADTDRILATLCTTLPVQVHALTRWWVTLRPVRRRDS